MPLVATVLPLKSGDLALELKTRGIFGKIVLPLPPFPPDAGFADRPTLFYVLSRYRRKKKEPLNT